MAVLCFFSNEGNLREKGVTENLGQCVLKDVSWLEQDAFLLILNYRSEEFRVFGFIFIYMGRILYYVSVLIKVYKFRY